MERPEVEKVLLPGTNGDNFPEAFPVGPEKFFKFSILHKGRMPGSEILFPGWLQCLRLVDGQPFQEPAQFLTGQFPGLGRILGPLEASLVQPLLHKDKTGRFLSEYSDKKDYPQPFVIRIFLPFILRYARFPGKNMRIKIILARRCGQVHLHHPAIPDLRIQ